MDAKGRKETQKNVEGRKRLPPVRIPLPFEQAVEGLLAVDPKGPVSTKKATKKPRPKK